MFPIRDARGRAIAFGGRAMAAVRPSISTRPRPRSSTRAAASTTIGPARAPRARPAADRGRGLHGRDRPRPAGFEAAVAPLGTAITETQLGLLWRVADEPSWRSTAIAPGIAAGQRLVDLALPLLAPGRGCASR
jgi:DNA primase